MSKHTPGPWFYRETNGGHFVAGPGGENSGYVAEVRHCRTNQNVRADARLIAAAPELLAALKAAMHFIDVHVADPDITNEMCQAWEALQKIDPRAAIAKAEGRPG